MKINILPIVILFIVCSAHARELPGGAASQALFKKYNAVMCVPAAGTDGLALSALKSALPNPIPTPQPTRYGGRRGTIYSGIEIGRSVSKTANDTMKIDGGGGAFKLELGWRYLMRSKFMERKNFIGIGLAYSELAFKEKLKSSPMEVKTKTKYLMAQLPLTYTSIYNAKALGVYWLVGTNVNFNYEVKMSDETYIRHHHKLWLEPTASLGFSILHQRGDYLRCNLIGPYIGFSATPLANEGNATIKLLNIGVRYNCIAF